MAVESPRSEVVDPVDYTLSSMSVLTTRDDMVDELFRLDGALVQASRVARGFARGKGRRRDGQFVDECETEAAFIVTSIIFTNLRGVLEKFPTIEERDKFYRMSVGYGLKAYFAHRHKSTISYLRKRGIEDKFIPLHAVDFAKPSLEVDMFIALEDAIRNEFERQVVEFYSIGLTRDEIAMKFDCSPLKIKNILKRIRKRLSGDIPKRVRRHRQPARFEGQRTRDKERLSAAQIKDDQAFENLCAGNS